jgi:hypothetical protein
VRRLFRKRGGQIRRIPDRVRIWTSLFPGCVWLGWGGNPRERDLSSCLIFSFFGRPSGGILLVGCVACQGGACCHVSGVDLEWAGWCSRGLRGRDVSGGLGFVSLGHWDVWIVVNSRSGPRIFENRVCRACCGDWLTRTG